MNKKINEIVTRLGEIELTDLKDHLRVMIENSSDDELIEKTITYLKLVSTFDSETTYFYQYLEDK